MTLSRTSIDQEWCDIKGLGILYKGQQTELMGEIDSDGDGRITYEELVYFLQHDASSETAETESSESAETKRQAQVNTLPTVPMIL
jgi:hypothetical protein